MNKLIIKSTPKTGIYKNAGKYQIWDDKTFLGSRDTKKNAIKLKKQFEEIINTKKSNNKKK